MFFAWHSVYLHDGVLWWLKSHQLNISMAKLTSTSVTILHPIIFCLWTLPVLHPTTMHVMHTLNLHHSQVLIGIVLCTNTSLLTSVAVQSFFCEFCFVSSSGSNKQQAPFGCFFSFDHSAWLSFPLLCFLLQNTFHFIVQPSILLLAVT